MRAMKNVNRLRISNSRIGAALAAQQAQRQASGHQQIAQGAEDAPIQMPERFEHFFHRVRIGLCTLCPQAWQNAPCRAVEQFSQSVGGARSNAVT